jgi:hypothetical protein
VAEHPSGVWLAFLPTLKKTQSVLEAVLRTPVTGEQASPFDVTSVRLPSETLFMMPFVRLTRWMAGLSARRIKVLFYRVHS